MILVGARAPAPFMEMDMKEEQDDLTLVYMFGYKNGQDSMKEEIERLRAALRTIGYGPPDEGDKLQLLNMFVEIARAALEGEKTDV